ncbi:DUF6771 family protein [Novosphingobium sp. P6W]|uniref:DUF6771 family protein n=1 Tax=Novosphingobium sp. P6W TaxID=1609758 RepID=UPI0005C2CCEA|nr:DUF6771 family protein [Novosphingobium sp. P6W]AXB78619.1 hypothetical protein TQ38_018555 [Novosphingobium sp. P6W]KIS29420.1 hypothetical protein TQ38_28880 [Novosphingobium sp. P6W]
MNDTLTPVILQCIARAPQWVRHDLESKDPVIRVRAEETLAAQIAAALRQNKDIKLGQPTA